MRTSILMWSTISGVILGIFIDAALVGITMLLGAFPPVARVIERAENRWTVPMVAAILIAVPLVLSVLGYLEGELKAI